MSPGKVFQVFAALYLNEDQLEFGGLGEGQPEMIIIPGVVRVEIF